MRPCRIVQGDIRAIFESSPALIKIKTIEKPWECILVFRQLQHEPVHILKNSSIAQEYVAGRSEPPTEVGGPLELPQGEASQHTMGQMSPELARVPEGKMPCHLASSPVVSSLLREVSSCSSDSTSRSNQFRTDAMSLVFTDVIVEGGGGSGGHLRVRPVFPVRFHPHLVFLCV